MPRRLFIDRMNESILQMFLFFVGYATGIVLNYILYQMHSAMTFDEYVPTKPYILLIGIIQLLMNAITLAVASHYEIQEMFFTMGLFGSQTIELQKLYKSYKII